MNSPMQAHYLALQSYETWAMKEVMGSLVTVPAENTAGPAFTRALQILGHIQVARRVWLSRLEGRPDRPNDWFPAWKPDQLVQTADQLDRRWHDFIMHAGADDFRKEIEYTSSEGVAYTSRVGDVLTHVYNHSTYHRGQVARLVTEAGGRRATTDYIALVRKQR